MASKLIRGTDRGGQYLFDRAGLVLGSRLVTEYESHAFTIPPATILTSMRVIVNHASACSCERASGAFGLIQLATQISIRNKSNTQIHVAFNRADADRVVVYPYEYLHWPFLEVTDVYLANNSMVPVQVSVAMV